MFFYATYNLEQAPLGEGEGQQSALALGLLVSPPRTLLPPEQSAQLSLAPASLLADRVWVSLQAALRAP